MTKFQYEDRLVAFVDILNFAGKIAKSDTDSEALDNICSTIQYVNDYFNKAKEDYYPANLLNITQFSDFIVISVKMDFSKEMLSIFSHLKTVQINLIKKNILLRGGIVKGKIIHNDHMLLGPGMVNAYYFESKCALHPRIAIDPQVLYQYGYSDGVRGDDRLISYDYHKTFILDGDGTSYIDYFNDVDEYLDDGNVEKYFRNLCYIVRDNIDSKNVSVRAKHLWMRAKIKSSEYYQQYKNIYKSIVQDRKKSKK